MKPQLAVLSALLSAVSAAPATATHYPLTLTTVHTSTTTFGVAPTAMPTPFTGFPFAVLYITSRVSTLQPFSNEPKKYPYTLVETIISDIVTTSVVYMNPAPRTTVSKTVATTTSTVVLKQPPTHTGGYE